MSIKSYTRSTDIITISDYRKPCGQNIFSSIDVAVYACSSTARAIPTANLQRQLFHHKTTMVTSFTTGIESVNFHQFSPVPLALILKLRSHFTPSCIRYRASQLAVFNHVSHPQVFDSNQAIFLNQLGGQLMEKIGTSIFNLSVYFSYFKSRFMSVIRAFGATELNTFCALLSF